MQTRRTHRPHHRSARPDSQYALSKAYGEAAGSYYADKHGLNVLAIRIGFSGNRVSDERRLQTWISHRDLAQLIDIGLTTQDLGFEIVFGVSNNPGPFFDNRNAHRLGYRPQDSSVDVLDTGAILAPSPALDTITGGVVGGAFASDGFDGHPARILR